MDRDTFSRRVRACEGTLYRVALSMLFREMDAEDAVQEAIFRAWRKLHTLHEADYFETWLVRILLNECKNQLKARARNRAEPLSEAIRAPEPPDPALRDALRALDAKFRLPLILHYSEDYSLEETARLLGAPLGTVKWRLKRGKALLERALKEEESACTSDL